MIKELIEFFRKNRGFNSLTNPILQKSQKRANWIFRIGLFLCFAPIAFFGVLNPIIAESQQATYSWGVIVLMVFGIALLQYAQKVSFKLMKKTYIELGIHSSYPKLAFHFYNTYVVHKYLKQFNCDLNTLQKIKKGVADSIPTRAKSPDLMQLIPFTTCLSLLGIIKTNSSPTFLIYSFIIIMIIYLVVNFAVGMIIETFHTSETDFLVQLKDVLEEIELNQARYLIKTSHENSFEEATESR